MTTSLPGIGGSLLPSRYLVDGIDGAWTPSPGVAGAQHVRLRQWWARVATRCGPATSVRELFDIAAMPLFAHLGFRARASEFATDVVHVRLETRQGTPVALVVMPWARRPAGTWRAIVEAGRAAGAAWAFILAPPFLSLVDVRGQASRHSVDFAFPEALDDRSIQRVVLLASAAGFDREPSAAPARSRSRIDRLVAGAGTYRDRVRADLQRGVIDALLALGPAVAGSGESVHRAAIQATFEQTLTIVYRILFLLFVESRDLAPARHPLYGPAYSVSALCRGALAPEDRHQYAGLWEALAAITRLSRLGCQIDDLIVRPFNGQLFARASAPSLEARRRRRPGDGAIAARDESIARALTAIGTRSGRGGREEIAYADLGVEQLGAVYERVLDLDPRAIVAPPARAPAIARNNRPASRASGRRAWSPAPHSAQRKQTGTFYTPQPLAEFVVRRTLAPLVRGASADAILRLRIVDPAMGSGAFLVAAGRFLAGAYERALVDEGRCADSDLDERERARLRRVIAERCLVGVDRNPTAVQLARLSIWLMTLAHGKPLGFLDHQLRVGNSLVGATPEDLWRLNEGGARRSPEVPSLFDGLDLAHSVRQAARPFRELIERADDTVADVRTKEALWRQFNGSSSALQAWRLACSLWCARFFWPDERDGASLPRPSPAECRAAIDAIVRGDVTLARSHVQQLAGAAERAAAAHGFFHWPLEFPDVFYDTTGASRLDAGFDAVLGNPPWEMLRSDDVNGNGAAARHRTLLAFIRESGLYPGCGHGHLNLYQPFLARALALVRPGGRVGLILPWGLATDDGTAELRRRVLDRCGQVTILGLDNAAGLFPIHRSLRFAAVALTRDRPADAVRMRLGVRTSAEIESLPDADDATAARSDTFLKVDVATLTAVGGAARRIPDFRRGEDLGWLQRVVQGYPPLGAAHGWGVRFGRELNVTDDRRSFGSVGLPVLEGKHLLPFAAQADAAPLRIDPAEAARLLPDRRHQRPRLAYRDVSGAANRLSLIAAIVPADVVTTHTIFCLRSPVPLQQQHYLCGLFNSYVLNAVVRMLMGAHVTTSLVEGLPVPAWTDAVEDRRIARLAARLAQAPGSRRVHAALQAAVARRYRLIAKRSPASSSPFRWCRAATGTRRLRRSTQPAPSFVGRRLRYSRRACPTTASSSICESASGAMRARSPARPSTTFPWAATAAGSRRSKRARFPRRSGRSSRCCAISARKRRA